MTVSRLTLKPLLLAATLAALPVAASTQPFQGFYLGGGGGYQYEERFDLGTVNAGRTSIHLGPQSGWTGLGSAGYGFGNGLRLEVEGNYRESDGRSVSGLAARNLNTGKLQTYGVMANALFDMDIGVPWLFPYVGAGAGYAKNRIEDTGIGTITPHGGTDFAFQAIGGLSFPVPDAPGLSVTAEYRFFDADNSHDHNALLGLRYAFGLQPPVIESAPAPASPSPSPSYLVFFDWDKAVLSTRARQIIASAAQNAQKGQVTRIDVNGYTDTSGTPQYNQGLSERRGRAVADELVHDGIKRDEIAVRGLGESNPLVPTGPGVREPQNRRVEIILH
jgi:outer membrane protein OmpA-like peptidoglycan-associated protein